MQLDWNANDVRAHAQDLAVSGSAGRAATAALVLMVPLPVFALLARTLAHWVKEIWSSQGGRRVSRRSGAPLV